MARAAESTCSCGCTAADRAKTEACHIPGCPYPAIARRAPKARERDLRHDAQPARFGAAVLKCEGFTPDCSYHGRCMMEGQCFADAPHLVAARMIETLLPPGGPAGVHFAYLRACAQQLRDGLVDL